MMLALFARYSQQRNRWARSALRTRAHRDLWSLPSSPALCPSKPPTSPRAPPVPAVWRLHARVAGTALHHGRCHGAAPRRGLDWDWRFPGPADLSVVRRRDRRVGRDEVRREHLLRVCRRARGGAGQAMERPRRAADGERPRRPAQCLGLGESGVSLRLEPQ